MRRWLPFPLLWTLLLGMWLALNESIAPGDVLLGALVALGAVHAYGVLQPPPTVLRRPLAMARLVALVVADIVRSNIAVGRIALGAGGPRRRSAFLDIPLELRHPAGLAALATIVTSTPGTVWARYDAARGVLTLHILDLIDEATWIAIIKQRYERCLMEIFE